MSWSLHRLISSRTHLQETLCVGCGKCAKSCPVGCIEMKERVTV
ncbi:4Fe-4S binding protein [Roseburia hominis]|nr:4Fe-4S binding protein [Roseburia hominis]